VLAVVREYEVRIIVLRLVQHVPRRFGDHANRIGHRVAGVGLAVADGRADGGTDRGAFRVRAFFLGDGAVGDDDDDECGGGGGRRDASDELQQ